MVVPDSYKDNRVAQQFFDPLGYVNPFMFKHSALYRFLEQKRICLSQNSNLWSEDTVLNNRDNVKKGLRIMERYCRDHNIPFIVVVYPHLQDYSFPWAGWLKQAHICVLQILNESGIKYVDLHGIYKSVGYERLKQGPGDPVYPNTMGDFITAKEVINKFYDVFGLSKQERNQIYSINYSQYEEN